ncbi:MAG: thermonuclease family protein [Sphingomonadales bacterium]|nr:thermonuclease family protein [Sphingomonadales bacterium]
MSFKQPFRATPIKLGKRYRAKARRERWIKLALPFAVVIGAAGVGAFWSGWVPTIFSSASANTGDEVFGCRVTDGDTIRCGDERIRLLAIDAPELPGHCRTGRECAPGDPYASTDSLSEAMTGAIRIERFGTDRYGRTLGSLTGDKGNLSCWQLNAHQAIYKAAWDNQMKIARTCPQSIL